MLIRYWQALVNRLDRPGRRLLLTVPGSLWVTFKYRSPCLVYWRDDAWIHHYRGAKIPHESLGRRRTPGCLHGRGALYGVNTRSERFGDD